MKKILCIFTIAFLIACGSEDNNTADTPETGDEKANTSNTSENKSADEDKSKTDVNTDKGTEETKTEDDTNTTGNDDSNASEDNTPADNGNQSTGDSSSQMGATCASSSDCTGDTNYCIPEEAGNGQWAGLVGNTCTVEDCITGNNTCPTGYSCQEIPSFVQALVRGLPDSLCGK